MNESCRNAIDVLAEEFLQRYRDGRRSTVEEFAAEHAEHADDIRNLFPLLLDMERLKNLPSSSDGQTTIGSAEIERLADFHIIREIGRGGMGVIFEAQQESLGRRVALKVIRADVAGSRRRIDRFRREAQAAAGLHHTNIVPVYGVGEDRGYLFYAMQYIDGVGLDLVLRALNLWAGSGDIGDETIARTGDGTDSSAAESAAIQAADALLEGELSREERTGHRGILGEPVELLPHAPGDNEKSAGRLPRRSLGRRYFKSIATLGAAVADALEHAHAHGILHRDIKPSNLVLDREGNIWVTDFGLAKQLHGDDLTETGGVVGTLRYMAPEQFNGHVDYRSDVYSLGLTLHELLTLRPAYHETRQGHLIREKTQTPPPRPRSVNPSIPRDLETIVLKACETEPARRYHSAAELAADLRRFAEERPIAARRIGLGERFWRWCRRNPAIAVSSGTAILLLVAVAAVAVIGNLNTKAALRETEAAKHDAILARGRAESNMNLALDAFEGIFDNVARRGIPQSLEWEFDDDNAPKFQSELTLADAELLRSLLTFYERFASENGDNADLRFRTAAAHQRIGEIHRRLGAIDEAAASYRRARSIYAQLLEERPDDVEAIVAFARCLNDQGELSARNMRPFPQAFDLHREAVEFLSRQPADIAKEPALRFELARAYDLCGSIFVRTEIASLTGGPGEEGPSPGGPSSGGRPRGPRGGPPLGGPGGPGGPGFGRPPGPPYGDSPPRFDDGGPPPLPLGMMPGGPPPGGPEGPEGPGGPGRPGGPRGTEGPRDGPPMPPGGPDGDLECARETLAKLAAEDPKNAEYRLALARVQRHQFVQFLRDGRREEGTKAFQAARDLLNELTAASPKNPRYLVDLADTLSLAGTRLSLMSEAETKQHLDRAVELCLHLTSTFPNVPEYQALLATSYRNLARVHFDAKRWADAEGSLALATASLESLVKHFPSHAYYEVNLALTLADLAEVKRLRGEEEKDNSPIIESRDLLKEAIARFVPKDDGRDAFFRDRVAATLYDRYSRSLESLGEKTAAKEAARNVRRFSKPPFERPFGAFGPGPDRRRAE